MAESLNEQQRRAAEYDGGHVLVLAGAGTGKTRTIIARAAHLIRRGVEPGRILLLTFTRRAAREMTGRLHRIVGARAGAVPAGTFHHFCLQTMRGMARAFGIERASVIDRDDQLQLMRLVRTPYLEKKKPFPRAQKLVDWHSYARNTNQPWEEYLERYTDLDEASREKVGRIFHDYEERKGRDRYLDFDDILDRFARRVGEDPRIRKRLRDLYDHILVDEMQDTNPLQWLILEGLRDPASLFCVGDDAQSIYAFRGADFRNVHSFTQRVPGATILRLQENYRSTQEILDLANWLLARSPLEYGGALRAHRGPGIRPRLLDFESDFDEANWITDDLVERHEGGRDWRDHMILTRTAWAARTLEATLVERDVPYRFIGGTQLMQSAHVKDLLALLRAGLSHRDELAWVRYLTLWPRVGDVTAARRIAEMRPAPAVPEALAILGRAFSSRPEIVRGPQAVLEHMDRPCEAIERAAEHLEPIQSERYERWEARKRDLALLVRLAERHASLLRFLEIFTLDPVSTTDASRLADDDAVTLITTHSAKGTEAPVCYLIRVEPGMYPHVRSLGDPGAEEEERRVLYVAMTRARNELILTRDCTRLDCTVFHGGAWADHARGGTPYFLDSPPEDLLDLESHGFEPFGAPDGISL